MTEFSTPQTQKRRADSRVSARRVASAALGDLLTSQGAGALSPLASGCLVALVSFAAGRSALETLGSSVSIKDAQTVLSMKGLSAHDSELSLSVLAMSGLVQMDAESLRIPLLDHAIRNEASTLANRVAGWRKRGASLPASSVRVAPVAAVLPLAAAANATPIDSVVQASPTPVVVTKPTAKKVATNGARRFSVSDKEPTDPATDPVMVRVLCDNGQVAELTAQYVEHLQDNFKSLDAFVQLKRAALWCESNPTKRKTFNGMRKFLTTWLGSAAREADVRNAVVRVGNQKNGFGQGGDYSHNGAPQAPEQASLALVQDAVSNDDFLDLVPAEPLEAAPVVEPSLGLAPVVAAPAARASDEERLPAPAAAAVRPSVSNAVLNARANGNAARAAAQAARANSGRPSGPARGSFLSQSQR